MSTTGVEGLVEAEDWEKHREFKKRIAYPVSPSLLVCDLILIVAEV
jgi:hypothetical protein